MIAAMLIALATMGPAGHDARRADERVTAPHEELRLDLADPFDDHGSHDVVAQVRVDHGLDLKDPFSGRRHALTVPPAPADDEAPAPTVQPSDLRDPFERRGKLHGDEPGCPKVTADNGATIQLPDGVTPPTCDRRGSPHLVNPFARPNAR